MRPIGEAPSNYVRLLLHVLLRAVAAAVDGRGDGDHAVQGDDVLTGLEAAVLGVGRPAHFARAVLVFGHGHEETLADAAFVAGARRYAEAADVAQVHAHEAPD